MKTRISEFDGLRGIAIGLVLWHHLIGAHLPVGTQSWLGWLRAGTDLAWCGVDLFFVLSGYFIGGILLDRWRSPRFARVFYLRRSLRIFPLYFLTLGVIFAAIQTGWSGGYHLYPEWVYGLFLTNFALAAGSVWDWGPLSVFWSLAVEEQFYLAAPWVVRAITPARALWLALGLILAAPGVRIALAMVWPECELAPHVLMPARMDTLALGILIAWGVRAPSARVFFAWLGRHWCGLLIASVASIGMLTVLRFRQADATNLWFGYTVLAVSLALPVAIVAGARPPLLRRILSFRPLVALGRHSYFVYLWHMLIGVGVVHWLVGESFVLDSPADFLPPALGIGVTWLAAAISWRCFEEPLIKWGHRHEY